MTHVIPRRPESSYPAGMTIHDDLEALLEQQRALLARLDALEPSAAEVLELGAEVLRFAEQEERAFFPLLPLLDPIARAELGHEHDELTEDLELLEWLVATTPESPDVEILAHALIKRVRNHVDRDGRLLLRASKLTLPS
jgi:hemerythrin HHE cation binding domain-containing protein